MITIRDFALGACSPKEIIVAIGGSEYQMINSYDGFVDKRMLSFFGDYVVEDFKANRPDEYCLFVLERPVKARDQ